MIKLTKTEQVIMEILWASDEPMLLSDIVRVVETQKRKIAKNSIQPMIKKLIDIGYIKVVGSVLVNKSVSRYYLPNITVNEYAVEQFQSLVSASNGKLSFNRFLAYFVNSKTNDRDKIISDMENFIDGCKKKNNNSD